MSELLKVSNLATYFKTESGLVKAVDGVTFQLKKDETLGLVGETGCGKTTVGRCVLRLYQPTEGKILFEGDDISSTPERKLKQIRSRMALIFQDPYSSLNPRQNAGSIVGEPLKIHHWIGSQSEYNDRVDQLFRLVGLDPSMKDRYPHEFSGGQRQRIGIARALACEPALIVCDEPVSALDVSIQAQVINLLEELQEGVKGLSYLFIAHDLSVVKHISDRVAVMYLGRIVEITKSRVLYENPLHPYTKSLLSAIPIADPFLEETRERIVLKGEVPSSLNPPSGCNFHPRCFMAIPECSQVIPPLRDVGDGHEVACIMV
jgi:oligopeptide/dipeptide ABC transporter ATP-binding protein